MHNKFFVGAFFCGVLLFSLSALSCKTFGGVPQNPEPLNYTDEDVVKAEKQRIAEILEREPALALWRAKLLNDEKTIQDCVLSINEQIKNSLSEKNYFEARQLLKSLEVSGFTYEGMSFAQADEAFQADVPGFSVDESKLPKSVPECIKATVTVLVDKGIKVKNGAGYADKMLGSGFFIDKRGYIVTNHHVISDMVDPKYEGFSRLYIKFSDDEDSKIPAKVVGYDSVLDLALLKAEVEPEFVLQLGSSSGLSVGDKVNAIGAPLGLEGSITSGIVSNTDRKLFSAGRLFQIDAPVNSGNSGGPCIDKDMKVQAIVFASILQSQGLNFAIPVEYLKQELPFLYAGGEFYHAWAGGFGRTKKTGASKSGIEVHYVLPGSTLCMAGVKSDDLITAVDGETVKTIEGLQSALRKSAPGSIVSLEIVTSSGEEKSADIYLENRPKDPSVKVYQSDLIQNSFLPIFGMSLEPSSTTYKKLYTVKNIMPNSSADDLSFSENDIVNVVQVDFDKENEYIIAQVYTKRQKKGFLDVGMILAAPFDNPYYF